MPGYVIHLATGNEYIKKHNDEIKDIDKFLLGVISPDLTTKENKVVTHYGPTSSELSLRKYLNENLLDNDFNKGYFLHLVTDFIFYNKLISEISKDIYNDYDLTNKYLIEKYNVKLLDIIKDNVHFKSGEENKIFTIDIAESAIEISSEKSLLKIKEEILSTEYNDYWENIRKLKHI